ncbi:GFA family protein [Acuticoccus sp. M5D2P5]|uniref:GFA family protein n=1 Tax=Acuticoccus kalidii TaxID=2910977 RepID=UPI001F40319F|nr:GFA family protein [Acuticoccus kalidii]MCF3935102.1 GFA family protein [Acuticoccus kalidii]
MAERHGRCACGAVTFTAEIPGDHVSACHCTTCRRINGGPFIVATGHGLTYAEGAPVGAYDSSEWADRTFCTRCGTSLAYRLKGQDMAFIAAYTFEPPLDLPLTDEVFIDEKPADYAFAGDTQTMTSAEVFALFQGQG